MVLSRWKCLLLVVGAIISSGMWLYSRVEDAQLSFTSTGSTMNLLYSLFLVTGLASATDFAAKCQNFNISIPNVQVNVLEFVANGTNITTLDAVRTLPLSAIEGAIS